MAVERIVHTTIDSDDRQEQELEVTLRPWDFANYIGQERPCRTSTAASLLKNVLNKL